MEAVVRRRKVNISIEDVKMASRKDYKWEGKTRYAVIVDGRKLPAKRLLLEVLKQKGLEFTLQDLSTGDAVHIFRKLGLKVIDLSEAGRKESILKYAGRLSMGGDAVEDKRRLYSS